MKKLIFLCLSVLLFTSYSFSQGEVEANRMSRNDIYGTARGISMGGAFGALGGDLTGVAINPAGIGVYRSSEIAGTAVLSFEGSKVGDEKNNRTTFNFDNLGFVGYFPLSSESVPLINFGFTYNKVKSFNKDISAFGNSPASSLMDYMADISSRNEGIDPETLGFRDNYDPFNSGAPWLSVLGYNSYLINPGQDAAGFFYNPLHNESITNSLSLNEKGDVNNYDFTVGTTIADKLNIGLSLTVTDIFYNLSSRYSEEFSGGASEGFDLRNLVTTEGAGVGAKMGVIFRPIHSLRIGVAYHTPVWYSLTDTYSAELQEDVTSYVINQNPNYEPATTFSDVFYNDYQFKTPDKWIVSLAGVFGNNFIASLDYEISDYSKMKFKGPIDMVDPESLYISDNQYISEDYKTTSTVRAGMEYRFTPQLSGRLGYAWMQNPYETEYFAGNKETATVGSTTIFRTEGDANFFTGGLGYRVNRNIYLDLALVYKEQTDKLYPFPNVFNNDGSMFIDASPFSLRNTNFKGLLTVGYKF